jgi:ribonuclease T2
MKQVGYTLAVVAGLGALGLYLSTDSPRAQAVNGGQTGRAVPLPKGTGFDFYVLALSWSPTYCQDSRTKDRDIQQCGGSRPFAFVVHGLWPQFERGFPRGCQTRFSRPSKSEASAMLDVMPSERLVSHEWEQHGACSGLSATDYLAVTRMAFQDVSIPREFQSASDWRTVTAGDVEAAFMRANPELRPEGIAVTKRGNLLSEVRLCFTPDLKPRTCREIDADGVPAGTRLSLPPSRG